MAASPKSKNFEKYKFRRQHPFDRYYLDFYCPKLKLAIEIDGSGHGYPSREKYDQAREKFLTEKGIAIIRFWNHQIREDFDTVMHSIWLAIQKRVAEKPSPRSSPFREGRGGATLSLSRKRSSA